MVKQARLTKYKECIEEWKYDSFQVQAQEVQFQVQVQEVQFKVGFVEAHLARQHRYHWQRDWQLPYHLVLLRLKFVRA